MLIKHKKVGGKGMFFIDQDDELLAELVYTMPGDHLMIIEHLEVSPELRGEDVAFNMMSYTVEYARQNNIKIIPLCPFARSVFEHKPEFGDVLSSE
jgi:predicted GNAT family acetyltransferase